MMARLLRLAMVGLLLTGAFAADLSAQQVRREEAQYVASSRGQVYYWIGCDAWLRLSPANLRYFRTAAEAEASGYRPSTARGCAPQLATNPIRPHIGGSATCTVSRIVDGDTFECLGGSRIRMLLVDTDETGQSAWADSATLFLRSAIPPGSDVRLEFDVALTDRYQRILAYVFADTVFVNRELARRGLAGLAVYPPNVRSVDVIRAAVDSARHEGLGIWSDGATRCTPADFRAGRCR